MTSISGDTTTGQITSDIDISFDEIFDDLDMGAMGIIEHRRNRWFFMGDLFYADLGDKGNLVSNRLLSVNADIKIKQLMLGRCRRR